ncbi:uncharacterized protein phf21ab [Osmerus eperlanus]|uniref:uncharacterized protein phf21ab n=1 Tax=Osmerus eperlanus TaxID=29151 RepID=UPI002E1603B4
MLQLDGIQPGDGVKAERFLGATERLTGSMMELQTLQEALKVEIQVHQKLVAQMKQDPQNADLKKQLHDLQAKITALSEKQKRVVEQLRKELLLKQEPEVLQAPCSHTLPTSLPSPGLKQTLTVTPVLTTKPLPLLLKAAASPPASLLSQRPTIAMVTALSNNTKPAGNTDFQNSPVNLQVSSRLSGQGSDPVRLMSKNTVVVQTTTTTTFSTQPIKVPQFVPPPRLTPRPTYQPQVRQKPAAPNNVPIAPTPPPPMMAAPQLLQRPLMLATKLSPNSLAPSLAPSAGPVHQVRIVNGQPCAAAAAHTQPAAPVAGIVIATPASSARLATPTHTLQVSGLLSDHKVRTMTVKAQLGPEQRLQVTSATPPLSPVARPHREDSLQKIAFMVSLGLVTHDHLEEIQSRRQERKRRTTANPVYSGAVFEPERKKSAVTYLNTPLHQGTRKRGRPPKHSSVPELAVQPPASPSSRPAAERPDAGLPLPVHPHPLPLPSPCSGDGDIHEDYCTVCRRSGQLLMCDTCSRVFHLDCLEPPLKTIPKGMWICPKCQDQILKKEEAIPWPGTLAIVHSYIAYKEAKEEEKQKLLKWSAELKLEREQLELRVKTLSSSITKCMETKNTILARQKDMHGSLEKVRHLLRLIQAFSFSQTLEEESSHASTEGLARAKLLPSQQTSEGIPSGALVEATSSSVDEPQDDIKEASPQNGCEVEATVREDTEPVEVEQVEVEPEQAEPGKMEPGKAEPGKAEPGKAEPGKAEPGEAEPGEAESGKAEPGEAETVAAAGSTQAGVHTSAQQGAPPAGGSVPPDSAAADGGGVEPDARVATTEEVLEALSDAPGLASLQDPSLATTNGHASTTPHLASTTPHLASTTPHLASTTPHLANTTPHLANTTPHLANTTPHLASTTPHLASTTPHLASTTPHLASTTPHLANTTPHLANTTPHLASTTPHLASTTPHLANTTPHLASTTPHLASTTLHLASTHASNRDHGLNTTDTTSENNSPDSMEQNTAEDSTEQATAEDSTEQATVEDSTEQATAEDSTEQATAEDSIEQATAEDSMEQNTAEDSTEQATAEDSMEQNTAEDSTEQATAEDSIEQATAEDSMEQNTAEDSTEQATAEDSMEQATAEDSIEQATAEDSTEQNTAEDSTKQNTAEDSMEQNTAEDSTKQNTAEDSTEQNINHSLSNNNTTKPSEPSQRSLPAILNSLDHKE